MIRSLLIALPVLLIGTPCVRAADYDVSPKKSIGITGATLGLPKAYWDKCVGDTWSAAWADDGNLYASCDDAAGWHSPKGSSNVCMSRIVGAAPNHLDGENVNPLNGDAGFGQGAEKGPDGATWKSSGTAFIDGVLYLCVSRHKYSLASRMNRQCSANACILKSNDHGATFHLSGRQAYDHPMFKGSLFCMPFFIDYGQNGNVPAGFVQPDNSDKYVYAISNDGSWDNGNCMRLGRVARSKLANLRATDWTFYKGTNGNLDGMHSESWTPDINRAGTILSEDGHLSGTGVTYIPGLGRYVMIEWHFPNLDDWQFYNSVWEFYESEYPWGPWTKFFTRNWEPHGTYNPSIPSKFISADGRSMTATYNGSFVYVNDYKGFPHFKPYTLTCIPLTLLTGDIVPGRVNDAEFTKGDLSGWARQGATAKVAEISAGKNRAVNAATISGRDDGIYQEVTHLTPGTAYAIRVTAKVAGGGEAVIGVRDYGGIEKFVTISEIEFADKTIEFVMGPNFSNAVVYLTKTNKSGEVCAYNFRLEPLIRDGSFDSGDLSLHWNPVDALAHTRKCGNGRFAAGLTAFNSSIRQMITGLDPDTLYRISATGKVGNKYSDLKMTISECGDRDRSVFASNGSSELTVIFKTGHENRSAILIFSKDKSMDTSFVNDVRLHGPILNPDFESGTTSWEIHPDPAKPDWINIQPDLGFTLDPQFVHSGRVSGRVAPDNWKNTQRINGLKPDTAYTLTAFARLDTKDQNKQIRVGVKEFDTNAGGGDVFQAVTSNVYTKVEVKFTTGHSDTGALVYFCFKGSTGAGFADCFRLAAQ